MREVRNLSDGLETREPNVTLGMAPQQKIERPSPRIVYKAHQYVIMRSPSIHELDIYIQPHLTSNISRLWRCLLT